MSWHFRLQQRHELRAARFAQIMEREAGTLTRMHRRITLHVRQSESALAVAAVSGAEQREERGVLGDGQYLPITPSPASGCEIKGKDANFSYKWICHNEVSLSMAEWICHNEVSLSMAESA
jgi:hypothetical protein